MVAVAAAFAVGEDVAEGTAAGAGVAGTTVGGVMDGAGCVAAAEVGRYRAQADSVQLISRSSSGMDRRRNMPQFYPSRGKIEPIREWHNQRFWRQGAVLQGVIAPCGLDPARSGEAYVVFDRRRMCALYSRPARVRGPGSVSGSRLGSGRQGSGGRQAGGWRGRWQGRGAGLSRDHGCPSGGRKAGWLCLRSAGATQQTTISQQDPAYTRCQQQNCQQDRTTYQAR